MSAELQTHSKTELATLLIPVNAKQLVLPNVTVAEIIPYMDPTAVDDVPNWFMGYINWRTLNVPLVSYEAINDEPFAGNLHNRRIAVLNGVIGDTRLPFCALATSGVPRLMRVMPDEIAVDEEAIVGPAEVCRVLVSGERAAIPDIDFIQQQVVSILASS